MATLTAPLPPQAAPVPARKLRYFYRCQDCLTVAVTEQELKPVEVQVGKFQYATQYGVCGACNGAIEFMGRTSGYYGYLVKTELRCPCDGRCTGAIGPSCDCPCGGENHGSGRLVEVVVEVGKLPRLMISPDAGAIAEEFRAAREQVKAAWKEQFQRVFDRKNAGEYLSGPAFERYLEGKHLWASYSKARIGRTHKGRLKALANVLAAIENN